MVIPYLNAENEYAKLVMSSTESLQQKIFNEIKLRINEEDQSAPVYYNGYYYYTRTEKGKQYRFYCRKKGSLSSVEELLFDVNVLADGKSAFLFAGYEVSPDNKYAAWLSNDTGSYADFNLKVRDLENDQDIAGFEVQKVQ